MEIWIAVLSTMSIHCQDRVLAENTKSLTSDLLRRIDDANLQLVARLRRHPFFLGIPILLNCLAVCHPCYTIGIPELIFTRVCIDGLWEVESGHGFSFVWI